MERPILSRGDARHCIRIERELYGEACSAIAIVGGARETVAALMGRDRSVTAFDVIHDLPRTGDTVTAIHAALRPGDLFLMVDIAASSHLHENLEHPLAPALYTASIFHCMTVSLAKGGRPRHDVG